MEACNMQTAVLQKDLFPVVLQTFLGEICCKSLLTLVQSAILVKGFCGTSTITCMTNCLHHDESRCSDCSFSSTLSCKTGSTSSDNDEENASEKCVVSILDPVPAPEVAGRVSRHYFSEWLLVTKNKDDEDEDEDEEDDDDDEGDEDDEEGDDEEGDDEEGGDAEGEEEGDEDDEEDEADDDEDEEDEDEDDDDDDDESPPKKLRK